MNNNKIKQKAKNIKKLTEPLCVDVCDPESVRGLKKYLNYETSDGKGSVNNAIIKELISQKEWSRLYFYFENRFLHLDPYKVAEYLRENQLDYAKEFNIFDSRECDNPHYCYKQLLGFVKFINCPNHDGLRTGDILVNGTDMPEKMCELYKEIERRYNVLELAKRSCNQLRYEDMDGFYRFWGPYDGKTVSKIGDLLEQNVCGFSYILNNEVLEFSPPCVNGWTVAHELASRGILPKWYRAEEESHVIASRGILPKWYLAEKEERYIAQLTDDNGVSVAEVYQKFELCNKKDEVKVDSPHWWTPEFNDYIFSRSAKKALSQRVYEY